MRFFFVCEKSSTPSEEEEEETTDRHERAQVTQILKQNKLFKHDNT